MKNCRICKTDKPLDCFYKDKGKKDGLVPYCKDCYRVKYPAKKGYYMQWYKKNRAKNLEYHKQYYKDNTEKCKEYDKKTKQKESYKKWKREYSKQYYGNNIVKVKAKNKTRKYFITHKLQRPHCQICESKPTQFHHFDYSLPFCGFFLCPQCHNDVHRKTKTLDNLQHYNLELILNK
jgi:hypothetical protein